MGLVHGHDGWHCSWNHKCHLVAKRDFREEDLSIRCNPWEENSENREIFLVWQKADDLESLREKLDTAIHEHLDSLLTKNLPPTSGTERENVIVAYILRLREEYLRSLEAKREEALALAAESGGTAAELAKLQEQGIDVSIQLGEVFTQRRWRR